MSSFCLIPQLWTRIQRSKAPSKLSWKSSFLTKHTGSFMIMSMKIMVIHFILRKSKLSMLKGCQGPYISIQIWVRGHYLKLEIKLESINSITRTSTHFTGQDKVRLTIKESGTQKLCTLIARFHRNLIPLQMNQSLKVRKKRTSQFLMSTSIRC